MKSPSKDPVQRIFAFAKERHSIWQKRAAGKPPPWTADEILANYRFTNVYRELDKVTIWIANHWRDPNAYDPDLWFAMCAARLLNQPECMLAVGYPVPWNRVHFLRILRTRKREGRRIFNAAYIVSTNGVAEDKEVYISDRVLDPLWQARTRLRPKDGDTLQSYHLLLGSMQGFGSFLTAQVIADLKYAQGSPLAKASDWWTFAASGPGSKRGLHRVLGMPALKKDGAEHWQEDEWRLELNRLHEKLMPMFEKAEMPKPHAQDIQNLLCEFDKYERARLDEGRPKQRYRV